MAGGNGVVFGDGLWCAGGQIVRLETIFSNASGEAQSSVKIATAGGVEVGNTRAYQYWHRNPVAGPCGMGFNMTNGVGVIWSL